MNRKTYFLILVVALVTAYVLGPAPEHPRWSTQYPVVPSAPDALEDFIRTNEQRHQLKPGNTARIVWADSLRRKTPYSIVYLHGFSASEKEGDPVHIDFARRYGFNLYLARLADHGIDTTEQLLYFTPDRFWESAKEALAIGESLGEKVIVMSCSTGGTVALALAAQWPEKVSALINMSPNIRVNNSSAFLLNNPWGLQIARLVIGSDYQNIPYDSIRRVYWNTPYRLEALTQLQEMLEYKMQPETFTRVTCPVLNIYYYKDEAHQDPTVSVKAMLAMHEQLGTPEQQKRAVAVPGAGAHVIGSSLVSKDIPAVETVVNRFAEEVLGLKR